MIVKDIASQSSVVFQTWYDWKGTISGVNISPVFRDITGGTTNHRSIPYSLTNISAKNYQNWVMCVQVIVCNITVVFWDTEYNVLSLHVAGNVIMKG